jgi:hypothetical protein
MKNLKKSDFQELSSDECLNNSGGGIIVYAFLIGLAVGYYEMRIKEN